MLCLISSFIIDAASNSQMSEVLRREVEITSEHSVRATVIDCSSQEITRLNFD